MSGQRTGSHRLVKWTQHVNHHSEYRQLKNVFSFLIFTWWKVGNCSCQCATHGKIWQLPVGLEQEMSLDTAASQAVIPHGLYDLAGSSMLKLSSSVWTQSIWRLGQDQSEDHSEPPGSLQQGHAILSRELHVYFYHQMCHWSLVETEFLALVTSDHVTKDACDKLWYFVPNKA